MDRSNVDHGKVPSKLRLPCAVAPGLTEHGRDGDKLGSGASPEFYECGDASIVSVDANECACVEDEVHAAVRSVVGGRYGMPDSAAIARSSFSSNAPWVAWCSMSQASTNRDRSQLARASLTTAEKGTPDASATRWAALRTSAGSDTVTRSVVLILSIITPYDHRGGDVVGDPAGSAGRCSPRGSAVGHGAQGCADLLATTNAQTAEPPREHRLRNCSEVVEGGDAVVVDPLVRSYGDARGDGADRVGPGATTTWLSTSMTSSRETMSTGRRFRFGVSISQALPGLPRFGLGQGDGIRQGEFVIVLRLGVLAVRGCDSGTGSRPTDGVGEVVDGFADDR